MLGTLSSSKLELIEIARNILDDDLEIPGIVVAGSQSAGKSSVLESLSGISFPTGKNITTRIPIILSIVNQPFNDNDNLLIDIDPSFNSFKETTISQLSNEIESVTNTFTENSTDVVDKPVYIKVYQKNSIPMTVIDLPGITHLSQNNSDIHQKTTDLVKKYIKNRNMAILCVVPAFEDFANCEAIKLSQSVDPDGLRTLGVITKLDIYPEDISDKINMTPGNISLNLGFIAVKNKSSKTSFSSLQNLRKEENAYFNKFYSHIDKNKLGVDNLIKKINILQEKLTDQFLPLLSKHVYSKLVFFQSELSKVKPEFNNTHEKKCFAISQIILIKDKFVNSSSENAQITRLCESFRDDLYNNKPDFTSESMINITKSMLNEHKGIMLSNFLNIKCFQKIFCEIFRNVFIQDTQSFIHNISVITLKSLQNIVNNTFFKYSNFRSFLIKHCDKLFESLELDLLKHVDLVFNIEQSIIFTQSEYYSKNLSYLRENNPLPDNIDSNTAELIFSLQSYYHIVLCRFVDLVPMTAYYFFTTRVEELFISEILPSLDESLLDKLLIEEESITNYRSDIINNYSKFDSICKKINSLST